MNTTMKVRAFRVAMTQATSTEELAKIWDKNLPIFRGVPKAEKHALATEYNDRRATILHQQGVVKVHSVLPHSLEHR